VKIYSGASICYNRGRGSAMAETMTPEVEALGPITPDGDINFEWVGGDGRTLREWHIRAVEGWLAEQSGVTPELREYAEGQFKFAVESGLIT
jgi:hypothetical protein